MRRDDKQANREKDAHVTSTSTALIGYQLTSARTRLPHIFSPLLVGLLQGPMVAVLQKFLGVALDICARNVCCDTGFSSGFKLSSISYGAIFREAWIGWNLDAAV